MDFTRVSLSIILAKSLSHAGFHRVRSLSHVTINSFVYCVVVQFKTKLPPAQVIITENQNQVSLKYYHVVLILAIHYIKFFYKFSLSKEQILHKMQAAIFYISFIYMQSIHFLKSLPDQ